FGKRGIIRLRKQLAVTFWAVAGRSIMDIGSGDAQEHSAIEALALEGSWHESRFVRTKRPMITKISDFLVTSRNEESPDGPLARRRRAADAQLMFLNSRCSLN